ncbi:MAG: DUF1926 domain-containing protein [Fibrobacter sp.]|nr:DUF1926 domain-containing protein [Fibrobacter sp.]
MKPTLSIVLQLPPSTAYAKLDAVAENLLAGMSKVLESGKLRFSIFMDGPTLEAASRVARPLMFGRFRKAIEDGSLEFLGGGFYDPMLPLFPTELQSMQLQKQGALLWKHFSIEPAGYFNSSLVWEMEMTELLEKHRFEYALVQESALQDALGRNTPVSGWYSVEDKGSFLRIVPVSETVSDAIANDDFRWAELAEPYCRGGKTAVVLLDVPPAPGDIVPFFERLLDFVETNDLQTKTVASMVNEQNSEGRLSSLLSAGRKIGLPATAKTCRELLIRRPEVNLLHKSLLSLYRRCVGNMKDKARSDYLEMLLPVMSPIYYRDMQDCEGMRSPMVRWWGSRFLVQAANRMADVISFDGIRLSVMDFLLEGRKLIWAENHSYSFLLDYYGGGILRILNGKSSENSLLGAWRDDGEAAVGFMDFLIPNMELGAAKLEQMLEYREGALREPYDYQMKRHEGGTDILLLAEQHFALGKQAGVLHVEKFYELSSEGSDFTLRLKLTNAAFAQVKGFFGTLLETGLLACDGKKDILVNGSSLSFDFRTPLIYPDATEIKMQDKVTTSCIRLEFEKPAALLVSPMFGASASAAPEALQGIRLFPFWKVALDANDEECLNMKVRFSKR